MWAALEKVPGHEEWKVRNLMALATCQADAAAVGALAAGAGGKAGGASADEAGKTLQVCWPWVVCDDTTG